MLRNRSGFGLMETLIAVGISATVLGGIMGAVKYFTMAQSTMAISQARDQLLQRLQYGGNNNTWLQISMGNAANATSLQPCGTVNGTNNCTANTPIPFNLFEPNDAVPAAGATAPVLYDVHGRKCANQITATQQCPFEALATFSAFCAGNAPTCDMAQSLQVVVRVRQSAAIARIPQSTLNFGDRIANAFNAWSVSGSAIACNDGFIYNGNDIAGNPICQQLTQGNCPPGSYLYDLDKSGGQVKKLCRSICPPNWRLDKFDAAGAPVCVASFSANSCTDPNGGVQNLNAFVRGVNFETRTVTCAMPGFKDCPGGNGQYMYGIAADGTPQCQNLPTPAAPPPAPVFTSCTAVDEVQAGNNPDGSAICRKTAGRITTNPAGMMSCVTPARPLIGFDNLGNAMCSKSPDEGYAISNIFTTVTQTAPPAGVIFQIPGPQGTTCPAGFTKQLVSSIAFNGTNSLNLGGNFGCTGLCTYEVFMCYKSW